MVMLQVNEKDILWWNHATSLHWLNLTNQVTTSSSSKFKNLVTYWCTLFVRTPQQVSMMSESNEVPWSVAAPVVTDPNTLEHLLVLFIHKRQLTCSCSESQLPCNVSEFNLHLTSENCRATRVNQVGHIAPLLGVSILPCPIQLLPDVLGDGIVFHGVEDQQYFCKVTICATIWLWEDCLPCWPNLKHYLLQLWHGPPMRQAEISKNCRGHEPIKLTLVWWTIHHNETSLCTHVNLHKVQCCQEGSDNDWYSCLSSPFTESPCSIAMGVATISQISRSTISLSNLDRAWQTQIYWNSASNLSAQNFHMPDWELKPS